MWQSKKIQTVLLQSTQMNITTLPILYSFRRCPYAIRARMAIAQSGIHIEQRDILLRQKPKALLKASPKGTVPVLILPNGQVMDESWHIMLWALQQNDPDAWLLPTQQQSIATLIKENDHSFKTHLDHYKYAVRHPQQSMQTYRQAGEVFLQTLEMRLQQHPYLMHEKISIADIAIMPFIRQFAHVDKVWFEQANYPQLRQWLNHFLGSELFQGVMQKRGVWEEV